MSLKDALAKARESRPEPVLQAVVVGDDLFQVELRRLDGMDWAGVTAECPPTDESGARYGYDINKAALIACRRFSRLLDSDGEPVDMSVTRDAKGAVTDDPWANVFKAISGAEIGAIAAMWWGLNMLDPNTRVVELKKALAGGGKTSSS